LDLVLGDPDPDRGQVEHLPSPHTDLHALACTSAATPTTGGFVADDLIRVGYLLQGAPAPPRLTTGFTAGFLPQRLRIRLGQPVRGRWLRGVPRIRRHLPLQLGDLRIFNRDMGPQLNHQIGEFLIGRFRHKPIVSQNNTKPSPTRR